MVAQYNYIHVWIPYGKLMSETFSCQSSWISRHIQKNSYLIRWNFVIGNMHLKLIFKEINSCSTNLRYPVYIQGASLQLPGIH